MRLVTGLNSYQDPPRKRLKILSEGEEKLVREFGNSLVPYHATSNPNDYFSKKSQAHWADSYKKEQKSKDRGEHNLLNVSGKHPFFAQDWRGPFEIDREKARGNPKLLSDVNEDRYVNVLGGTPVGPNIFDHIEKVKGIIGDDVEIPNFGPTTKTRGKGKPEIGVGEPPEIKAFLRESYRNTEDQRFDYQAGAMKTRTWHKLLKGGDLDTPYMSRAEEMAGVERGSLHRNRKKKERLMLNSYVGNHKGGWIPASSIAAGINGRYGKNFTSLMGK